MRKETINTFSDGLVKDVSALSTPKNVLTDCLNGTFLTYDGNELVLQNDKGNYKLQGSELSKDFMPVGIASYGDILYVVSYNPITQESEIGSFPSPNVSVSDNFSNELEIKSIISQAFAEHYGDPDFEWTKENLERLYKKDFVFYGINGDMLINPGDQYCITNPPMAYDYERLNYYIFSNSTDYRVNPIVGEETAVNWEVSGHLKCNFALPELTNAKVDVLNMDIPTKYQDQEDKTWHLNGDTINLVCAFSFQSNDALIARAQENDDIQLQYRIYSDKPGDFVPLSKPTETSFQVNTTYSTTEAIKAALTINPITGENEITNYTIDTRVVLTLHKGDMAQQVVFATNSINLSIDNIPEQFQTSIADSYYQYRQEKEGVHVRANLSLDHIPTSDFKVYCIVNSLGMDPMPFVDEAGEYINLYEQSFVNGIIDIVLPFTGLNPFCSLHFIIKDKDIEDIDTYKFMLLDPHMDKFWSDDISIAPYRTFDTALDFTQIFGDVRLNTTKLSEPKLKIEDQDFDFEVLSSSVPAVSKYLTTDMAVDDLFVDAEELGASTTTSSCQAKLLVNYLVEGDVDYKVDIAEEDKEGVFANVQIADRHKSITDIPAYCSQIVDIKTTDFQPLFDQINYRSGHTEPIANPIESFKFERPLKSQYPDSIIINGKTFKTDYTISSNAYKLIYPGGKANGWNSDKDIPASGLNAHIEKMYCNAELNKGAFRYTKASLLCKEYNSSDYNDSLCFGEEKAVVVDAQGKTTDYILAFSKDPMGAHNTVWIPTVFKDANMKRFQTWIVDGGLTAIKYKASSNWSILPQQNIIPMEIAVHDNVDTYMYNGMPFIVNGVVSNTFLDILSESLFNGPTKIYNLDNAVIFDATVTATSPIPGDIKADGLEDVYTNNLRLVATRQRYFDINETTTIFVPEELPDSAYYDANAVFLNPVGMYIYPTDVAWSTVQESYITKNGTKLGEKTVWGIRATENVQNLFKLALHEDYEVKKEGEVIVPNVQVRNILKVQWDTATVAWQNYEQLLKSLNLQLIEGDYNVCYKEGCIGVEYNQYARRDIYLWMPVQMFIDYPELQNFGLQPNVPVVIERHIVTTMPNPIDVIVTIDGEDYNGQVQKDDVVKYASVHSDSAIYYPGAHFDVEALSWIGSTLKLDMTAYQETPEALRESDAVESLYWRKYFDVLYDKDLKTPITLLCS